MTPREIRNAMRELAEEISPNTHIGIHIIEHGGHDKPLYGSIYPDGICGHHIGSVYVEDWHELMPALHELWGAYADRHHAETVKKLALAIIRITHEQGECTDAALRVEFSQQDIDRYGEEAVAQADQMASNGPFCIRVTTGANAA